MHLGLKKKKKKRRRKQMANRELYRYAKTALKMLKMRIVSLCNILLEKKHKNPPKFNLFLFQILILVDTKKIYDRPVRLLSVYKKKSNFLVSLNSLN